MERRKEKKNHLTLHNQKCGGSEGGRGHENHHTLCVSEIKRLTGEKTSAGSHGSHFIPGMTDFPVVCHG